MNTPLWIVEAKRHMGLTEINGAEHAQEILKFWKDIKRGGIQSDEIPWCAAFVGACLERVGVESTRFESAGSYLTWGVPLSEPIYGCVAVFSRSGGGHVGFVMGQDEQKRLMVLGGNQNNAVNVTPFDTARVTGCRWPKDEPIEREPLPFLSTAAASSTNEA